MAMHRLFCVLLITSLLVTCGSLSAKESTAKVIAPGKPIDYTSLAFFPNRWKEKGISTEMTPWEGKRVVLLTTSADFDHQVMTGLLAKLDGGWQLYRNLTGRSPRMMRQLRGKPTLAAVPGSGLTCGYGCGYVGATGIELSAFYNKDYQDIQANPKAIPDYYFYEMGRNYYTFGDRHSLFITGYAVFMRYVCVDALELHTDNDLRTTIEEAESLYTESDMPFLDAFTTLAGLSEKQNRLAASPSDQPVMYASAMLRLRRDYGEDKWVKRFFTQLARCPEIKPTDERAAMQQSLCWLTAASCAAGEDLSPVFVDQWRLPLTERTRHAFSKVRWGGRRLDAGKIVARLLRTME